MKQLKLELDDCGETHWLLWIGPTVMEIPMMWSLMERISGAKGSRVKPFLEEFLTRRNVGFGDNQASKRPFLAELQ